MEIGKNMSKPVYFENEKTVFIDCDDTLVMHYDEPRELWIPDPYTTGYSQRVRPHERHIKLLKDFKARGYTVVVWSAAGGPWARNVVEALELERHVDLIMSKPLKYVDDLPATEVMGIRIYLNEKGNIQDEG